MHANAIVIWSDPATPLQWGRTFPGTAEHARLAREFVRYLLGDTPIVDDAVLAVSELATNTVQHSRTGQRGGRFTVKIHRWANRATVSVTDDGNRLAAATDQPNRTSAPGTNPSGDVPVEGGRGLSIVEAVASTLTWRGSARGRTFIAEFSW
jgi:anti-sigma regulatory factor (Ser/Thr protein kinase)